MDRTSLASLVRCQTVWYEDGNLVLQAGNTLFKVHRGVLAAKSVVFRDMLAFPQPSGDETIDGYPAVQLSDHPLDLEHALRAMYGERSYFDSSIRMMHTIMAALLRIGTKYEMGELRQEATGRLASDFPDSLDRWMALADHRTSTFDLEDGRLGDFTLANLAFEHGVAAVLPALYLQCSFHAYSAIAKGSPGTGSLSGALLPTVISGEERLHRAQSAYLYEWYYLVEHHGAKSGMQCLDQAMYMERLLRGDLPWYRHFIWDDDFLPREVCDSCRAAIVAEFELGRAKLWDKLPLCFDLPRWAEIRNAAGQ